VRDEELSNHIDSLGTGTSTTAMGFDIRKDGDYKQPLLRRVEDMNEEVTIDMPVV